ncbi:uncharacterized protein LOC132799442 [Ziziphus jujuba]|uniref:Uncharacterized protein LOC132799442 n=1 Tax=Ziziphus jujuba TaxID=326968 RepID=A0ABM3ZRZ7_ZIZJJ|nr:uncharacterized protein LOC132799442 [Ziziphus jujuba]
MVQEGWSLAELFQVRCIVAAPYVVPCSAPSSFERQFKKELPLLYKYLQESPSKKVYWKDVIHWMWPLFTEYWRNEETILENLKKLYKLLLIKVVGRRGLDDPICCLRLQMGLV